MGRHCPFTVESLLQARVPWGQGISRSLVLAKEAKMWLLLVQETQTSATCPFCWVLGPTQPTAACLCVSEFPWWACRIGIAFSINWDAFTWSSLGAGRRQAGKMPWKEENDPARQFPKSRRDLVPQNCLPTRQPTEMAACERHVCYRMLGRPPGRQCHWPVP